MLKWRVLELTDEGRMIEYKARWERYPFKYERYDSPEEAARAIVQYAENESEFQGLTWVDTSNFVVVGVVEND